MGKVTLVNGKHALRADGLEQAVKDAPVQIASLVIQAGHNRVWKPSQLRIIAGNSIN